MKTAEEKKEAAKKYATRKPEDYNFGRQIWQWLVTKFWYGMSYKFIYRTEVYGKEISFKQSKIKVSFWVNNFNDKDKYKIIITNEIRKFIKQGENDE